jgi:hypothetical protein
LPISARIHNVFKGGGGGAAPEMHMYIMEVVDVQYNVGVQYFEVEKC